MQEVQETQVRSWGQENPLGEEMATRSSILAWRTLWSDEFGVGGGGWGYSSWGCKALNTT